MNITTHLLDIFERFFIMEVFLDFNHNLGNIFFLEFLHLWSIFIYSLKSPSNSLQSSQSQQSGATSGSEFYLLMLYFQVNKTLAKSDLLSFYCPISRVFKARLNMLLNMRMSNSRGSLRKIWRVNARSKQIPDVDTA